jgi:hypothetical protein
MRQYEGMLLQLWNTRTVCRTICSIGDSGHGSRRQRRCEYKLMGDKEKNMDRKGNGLINKYNAR